MPLPKINADGTEFIRQEPFANTVLNTLSSISSVDHINVFFFFISSVDHINDSSSKNASISLQERTIKES